jgi:3-hydroxyisobutyrate dehydrogenase-like beta-hydroxyacid dehydrogenase
VAELGASLADSVPDLARASDILISCLFSDAQIRELGVGPRGFIANAKPDAVFVSHTTGTVATLSSLVAESISAPVILDCPGKRHRGSHRQRETHGADRRPCRRNREGASGARRVCRSDVATGALGTALNITLINNLLFAANAQLVAAASELGERLGVDETNLLAALEVCSGRSNASSYAEQTGGIRSFATKAAPFLRKDIAACLIAAESVNADLGLLGEVVRTGGLNLTGGA